MGKTTLALALAALLGSGAVTAQEKAPTTHAAANLNPAFIPFLLRALVFVGQDMVLFHILAERHTSPAEKSRARNERRFLLSECM